MERKSSLHPFRATATSRAAARKGSPSIGAGSGFVPFRSVQSYENLLALQAQTLGRTPRDDFPLRCSKTPTEGRRVSFEHSRCKTSHARARAPPPSRRARDAMVSISFSRSTPIPRVARRTSRARVLRASRDDEARRMDLDAVLRSTPTPTPTTKRRRARIDADARASDARGGGGALRRRRGARTLTVRTRRRDSVRATMRSPLGVVFEDVDGDRRREFYDESEPGPRGRGIEIGDVLRATSAEDADDGISQAQRHRRGSRATGVATGDVYVRVRRGWNWTTSRSIRR